MPMQIKAGKGQNAVTTTVQTDEDFDDMLAELCAADLIATTGAGSTGHTRRSSSSSSNVDSRSRSFRSASDAPDSIAHACISGDIAKLRKLSSQGARVSSLTPLNNASFDGNVELMRCLVKGLGADVNQLPSGNSGRTPLFLAAQEGHLAAVLCLVKELGADINKSDQNGRTPLLVAIQMAHLSVIRCLCAEPDVVN
jgi:ankyrin repeat protein